MNGKKDGHLALPYLRLMIALQWFLKVVGRLFRVLRDIVLRPPFYGALSLLKKLKIGQNRKDDNKLKNSKFLMQTRTDVLLRFCTTLHCPNNPTQAVVPNTQVAESSHAPASGGFVDTQQNVHQGIPGITISSYADAPEGGVQCTSSIFYLQETSVRIDDHDLRRVHPYFYPTTPETGNRYDRHGFITLPEGWKMCIHPEGARYFFHPEKRYGHQRVYTDANILDEAVLGKLLTSITDIFGYYLVEHGSRWSFEAVAYTSPH
ncbi:hypothetical protein K435DRAFT_793304 [Dendrothele bispora CBS 962.96]|uniref:WW domain-containing protein n=1 Tax=Dendrothele bispora (strain CBS 962.96) TaxID=1314807 RepID=A0A4S8MGB1_DENBC|nr:hypothetical protein K435DRAFT_793304 [Dendrothele bispora CBS 962.96]